MAHRICSESCPADNIRANATKNCRKCNNHFHLPCYDVIQPPNKLFVTKNIVFICDACLEEIDNPNSPDRKRKIPPNNPLRQSILTSNANGTVGVAQQQQSQQTNTGTGSKKPTNEQIFALLTTISGKMDVQTNKIDEIGHNLSDVEKVVVETNGKSDGLIKLVQSRTNFTNQNIIRNLAKDAFRPQPTKQQQTPNGTTNAELGSTSVYRQKYSTVVKSQLLVTPRPENGQQRKRQKTISLIDNETGTTIETATLPSPQQGTKDIELGKPVERPKTERKTASHNLNTLSEAFCVSNFHPETTTEEIENYIIEHTQVKDKSKFKVTKMVKRDADLTQLTYVTFKIDIAPQFYSILYDCNNWPKNKTVREFRKMLPPKPKINDFISQQTPTMNVTASSGGSSGNNNNNDTIGNTTVLQSKNAQ